MDILIVSLFKKFLTSVGVITPLTPEAYAVLRIAAIF